MPMEEISGTRAEKKKVSQEETFIENLTNEAIERIWPKVKTVVASSQVEATVRTHELSRSHVEMNTREVFEAFMDAVKVKANVDSKESMAQ